MNNGWSWRIERGANASFSPGKYVQGQTKWTFGYCGNDGTSVDGAVKGLPRCYLATKTRTCLLTGSTCTFLCKFAFVHLLMNKIKTALMYFPLDVFCLNQYQVLTCHNHVRIKDLSLFPRKFCVSWHQYGPNKLEKKSEKRIDNEEKRRKDRLSFDSSHVISTLLYFSSSAFYCPPVHCLLYDDDVWGGSVVREGPLAARHFPGPGRLEKIRERER